MNIGDYSGELWESFGIDLSSRPGKIKTSKQLKKVLTEAQMGNASAVIDLLIWDDEYVLCTEDSMYTCPVTDDPTVAANWDNDGVASDLDLNSSAIVFNDGTNTRLRIALDTDIAEWDGGGTYDDDWWTTDKSGTALNSGYPHMLAKVQSQKETMYVTDKNRVQYYEKGAASSQIVELDSNVVANCLAPGLSGAMWVGTYNETDGFAYVYEIYTNEEVDGTPVYREAYPVEGRAVLAIWLVNNTPHIVTERGVVHRFNGAGFAPFAYFPIQFDVRHLDSVQPGLIQDSPTSLPIHPRGVKVKDNYTYILLNTDSEEDVYAVNNRAHSGIWELDNTTGSLTNKFPVNDASTDAGHAVLQRSGPLLIVDNQHTFALAGLEIAGLGACGLYGVQDTYGTSYFTTPESLSMVETDTFLRVIHKASIKDDGAIYTLYRTSKQDTIYATLNWTSATSFTSTDDLSNLSVGNLLRISHGYAAGKWAIVKSVTSSTSTYTVTIDRALGADTETSYAYFDNFKLVGFDTDTLTYDSRNTFTAADGEHKRIGLDIQASWIQVMVILEGDIEYRMFDLVDGAKENRK